MVSQFKMITYSHLPAINSLNLLLLSQDVLFLSLQFAVSVVLDGQLIARG